MFNSVSLHWLEAFKCLILTTNNRGLVVMQNGVTDTHTDTQTDIAFYSSGLRDFFYVFTCSVVFG